MRATTSARFPAAQRLIAGQRYAIHSTKPTPKSSDSASRIKLLRWLA